MKKNLKSMASFKISSYKVNQCEAKCLGQYLTKEQNHVYTAISLRTSLHLGHVQPNLRDETWNLFSPNLGILGSCKPHLVIC